VEGRVGRNVAFQLPVVAGGDAARPRLQPQPVPRLRRSTGDDLVAAVRGDVELGVVQRRDHALREMTLLGPGLHAERGVTSAVDVAANAVAACRIHDGSVIDGIGVVAEQLLRGAEPALKERACRIDVVPALESVLQRIRDEVLPGSPLFGRVHAAIGTDVACLDLAERRGQVGEGARCRIP